MLKFDRLLYVTVNLYTIYILLKTQPIQGKMDCRKCSNPFFQFTIRDLRVLAPQKGLLLTSSA